MLLAASDFASTLVSVVIVLAVGAIGGFYWCRKQSGR
jgi:hypothetical protein